MIGFHSLQLRFALGIVPAKSGMTSLPAACGVLHTGNVGGSRPSFRCTVLCLHQCGSDNQTNSKQSFSIRFRYPAVIKRMPLMNKRFVISNAPSSANHKCPISFPSVQYTTVTAIFYSNRKSTVDTADVKC
jgi:hypothetical protein